MPSPPSGRRLRLGLAVRHTCGVGSGCSRLCPLASPRHWLPCRPLPRSRTPRPVAATARPGVILTGHSAGPGVQEEHADTPGLRSARSRLCFRARTPRPPGVGGEPWCTPLSPRGRVPRGPRRHTGPGRLADPAALKPGESAASVRWGSEGCGARAAELRAAASLPGRGDSRARHVRCGHLLRAGTRVCCGSAACEKGRVCTLTRLL